MIVLDTNIVSDPIKPQPDPNARRWIDAQPSNSLFICSPVLAEMRFGVERLAQSGRRDRLLAYVERVENDLYRGRVLPLDAAAAVVYGRIAAARERMGRRIEQMDALIAAIALTHGATLATRDIDDFAGIGLDVINPFGVG